MYTSLAQFYNSEEWRSFRRMLIDARKNKDNGILYCEHSGVPLTRSYDIVAHHIIPLTMANVNDFSISLNPDNIMLVSQKAHNEIHARFGYCAQRKVYIVYGPPASGKTTFVQGIKGNSDIVMDIDSIWECITGGPRYFKPDALKANAFILRDALLDSIRTRAGKWENAYIITGGALKGERERLTASLGAELIFIDESRETCLERLASAADRTDAQKKEWESYIDLWFMQYSA